MKEEYYLVKASSKVFVRVISVLGACLVIIIFEYVKYNQMFWEIDPWLYEFGAVALLVVVLYPAKSVVVREDEVEVFYDLFGMRLFSKCYEAGKYRYAEKMKLPPLWFLGRRPLRKEKYLYFEMGKLSVRIEESGWNDFKEKTANYDKEVMSHFATYVRIGDKRL